MYEARLRDAIGTVRAVAKVTFTRGRNHDAIQRLKYCAEIHRRLHDHPGIIKVYGAHVSPDNFVLLMERALGEWKYQTKEYIITKIRISN